LAIHKAKNILVAPLDWGLGHTTRCVPIIRYLRSLGHQVIFAGNEWQRSFTRATFVNIPNVDLEGYNISYSKWNRFAQAGVLSQLPGLHKRITDEHKWLAQTAHGLKLDGIVSDNRYGIFHEDIPSVIMTHQLQVQTGMGNLMDRMVQKIHYKYLDRFDATWVVDSPVSPGLGGILSHAPILPKESRYIGLLSQFEGVETDNTKGDDLLILLSGPEPQRTDLSRILWQEVQGYNGKVIFVEGSNSAVAHASIPKHITYYKLLANEQLVPLLAGAGIVICRSGYSTLMDLVALHKKAILIPTPGQTEQKYLGKHLHETGVFYTTRQIGFHLNDALKESEHFPYNSLSLKGAYSVYKQVIDDWLQAL